MSWAAYAFEPNKKSAHEVKSKEDLMNPSYCNLEKKMLKKSQEQIVNEFYDEEPINPEASIPILRSMGLIKRIQSIHKASLELSQSESDPHLQNEAQFIFYLWEMIGEEHIQTGQLKQIIHIICGSDQKQAQNLLKKLYEKQKVINFVEAWIQHIGEASTPIKDQKDRKKVDKGMGRPPLVQTFHLGENDQNHHLSKQQEKGLIQRLYKTDIHEQRQQMRKQNQKQKQEQQMEECTFRPNIMRGRSAHQRKTSEVKGYEKAVSRIKAGSQKNKFSDNMRDYQPINQNYLKHRLQKAKPPKFLEREKKKEEKVLFILSFDLGRHKTNVKIRETDTGDTVAQKLCRIYSLRTELYHEIRQIVKVQLETYYQELSRSEPVRY